MDDFIWRQSEAISTGIHIVEDHYMTTGNTNTPNFLPKMLLVVWTICHLFLWTIHVFFFFFLSNISHCTIFVISVSKRIYSDSMHILKWIYICIIPWLFFSFFSFNVGDNAYFTVHKTGSYMENKQLTCEIEI